MRSTYAANAGRAYAWSVYVDPLPVCREGYQSQPGRILWRKLTCLFVFICLFFAGVVFGLSSVYVQGGNRISTMFSALTVRNIMPGVPSGCFTGSLVSIYDNTLTNFANNTVQNKSFGRYFSIHR